MGRIRTIKPEFFKHEELFDAERESGLPLRLAFISLWVAADREGRFRWRPRALKSDCLPFDDCDFSRVLDALSTRGFIAHYIVDGNEYGWIKSFSKHQVVNNRERPSDIPEPNENSILTRAPRVDDACPTPLVHAQGEREGERELEREREREREETSSLVHSRTDPGSFDRFWQAWPNKVGKPAARQAFSKVAFELEDILAGIERYVRDKPGDRPWLNPSTFLNQRRWEDCPAKIEEKPNGREQQRQSRDLVAAGKRLARRFAEADAWPEPRMGGRDDGPPIRLLPGGRSQ